MCVCLYVAIENMAKASQQNAKITKKNENADWFVHDISTLCDEEKKQLVEKIVRNYIN